MITNKNISKHPKSLVEVTITVPWIDLEPKWNETLQKLAADFEMPGFRKGAVPPQIAEQKLSPQVEQDLLKVVMPQALIEALQGTDVVPIDYPQYHVISFTKGADLQFRAQITQRPTVTIGDFKSIKVQKPEPKQVTGEEIQKVLDDLFKRWKSRQSLPAAAPSQPVQNSTGASGSLSFNAPQVSPTAPVLTTETPNDDFAKGVGAMSLEDLKTKIKQDLEDEVKYNSELDFEEAILQQVEKLTQVDVPEVLVQDELNRMLVSLQRRVADMGLLMDDYLKNQGKSVEQIKTEWRPQAEKNVKMELGLSEIARQEGVTISDEDLQAEIDKITDARTKSQFDYQEPRMHLRHALRQTKTLNLLKTLVPSA